MNIAYNWQNLQMLNRKPEVGVLPHQAASQDPWGEEEPQQLHDQEAAPQRKVQKTGRGKRGFILRVALQDFPRAGDTERVQKQDRFFIGRV